MKKTTKKMAVGGAVARMPTPTVGAVDSIEKGTPTSGRTLARMPKPTNRMGSNDPRALNNNPRGSNLPNDNRMGGAISRGVDLRESVFKGNMPQIGLQKTQPASTRSMSGISNAASKKMFMGGALKKIAPAVARGVRSVAAAQPKVAANVAAKAAPAVSKAMSMMGKAMAKKK
jgi:hypothetical protein